MTTTTTYMSLTLPDPTLTIGPTWATMLNQAFTLLDSHDHSSGKGTQVPASGLNINADLSFGSYNATALKSTRFTSQASPLATAADLSCLYVSSGNLYFNNSGGAQIQITTGGSLNVAGLTSSNWARRSVSTDITIGATDTDVWYEVNSSGGARVLTLPAASGVTAGRFYVFGDTTGSSASNSITVAAAGSDLIDGTSVATLTSAYAALAVISDGNSKWKVLRYYDKTRLNGATVPASGTLTTGNVLQVSGSSALTYAALNLAGGAGYVTGLLPWANIATPIASSHYATAGVPGAIAIAGDIGGSATTPTVIGLTGTSGVVSFAASATSPTIKQLASASTAGQMLSFIAQDAGGSNQDGGHLSLYSGAPTGTGAPGRVQLVLGPGTVTFAAGAFSTSGRRYIALGGQAISTNIPNGDGVVWLANATTAPTTAPTGGALLYASGGALGFMGTVGTAVLLTGTTDTGVSSGNIGPTMPGSCQKWLQLSVAGTTYRVPLFA